VVATAAAGGPLGEVVAGGAVAMVPAGLAAAAAGTISVVQGAPAAGPVGNLVLVPEIAGLRMALPIVVPPGVATLGVLPVLAARHHRASAAATIGGLAPLVLVMVIVVVAWVRWRDGIHRWFRGLLRSMDSPPVR
jgi:hypothetical protein